MCMFSQGIVFYQSLTSIHWMSAPSGTVYCRYEQSRRAHSPFFRCAHVARSGLILAEKSLFRQNRTIQMRKTKSSAKFTRKNTLILPKYNLKRTNYEKTRFFMNYGFKQEGFLKCNMSKSNLKSTVRRAQTLVVDNIVSLTLLNSVWMMADASLGVY